MQIIINNDEIDEDSLLEEEDKIISTYIPNDLNDDCEIKGGKRSACKNCTCGRAESLKNTKKYFC